MQRWAVIVGACLVGALTLDLVPAGLADGQARATKPPARRTAAVAPVCASDLGAGISTRRQFCDVIIASAAAGSVSIAIPPHTGSATLLFDLHNRFIVPPAPVEVAQVFTRHVAVVFVIRQSGEIIERVATTRDYRTAADLFDRIAGSTRGAPAKAVAPGAPMPNRIVIPPGVNVVGIVGSKLEEWKMAGRGAFDWPGRAVAIVSNIRVEFTPR